MHIYQYCIYLVASINHINHQVISSSHDQTWLSSCLCRANSDVLKTRSWRCESIESCGTQSSKYKCNKRNMKWIYLYSYIWRLMELVGHKNQIRNLQDRTPQDRIETLIYHIGFHKHWKNHPFWTSWHRLWWRSSTCLHLR